MKKPEWFERKFQFGIPPGMLPFFIERLEGTIVRIRYKVEAQPDPVLSYQPQGKWSVKQHIGHLAEVDAVVLQRLDEIVNGISPMAPAVFDPQQDYNQQPVMAVLEYFVRNHIKNLNRYRTLTEAECTRTSLHPRLKVSMSAVDLAFFDAEHDDHHLVKMGEILATFKN